MKKTMISAMAFLLVVLLASQSMGAWGGWGPGRPKREPSFERLAEKLELTKEQKERFRAQNEKLREAMKADQSETKKLAEKLKNELQRDKPDRSKVRNLIKQIGARRTEMELKRMDSLLEMRQELTPEQRAKFKALLAPRSMRERRK